MEFSVEAVIQGWTSAFKSGSATGFVANGTCNRGEVAVRTPDSVVALPGFARPDSREPALSEVEGAAVPKCAVEGVASLFVAGVAVVDGVEDQLDAARDAELFEDAEKIFLYGVLAEVELDGDGAVGQAFNDERDYLLLARG